MTRRAKLAIGAVGIVPIILAVIAGVKCLIEALNP